MEYLSNGYVLETDPDFAPVSTDSLALAEFVKIQSENKICDLGCGCGILMLLLATDPTVILHGVENMEAAAKLCRKNLSQKDLPQRTKLFEKDLRCFDQKDYDIVISNPPYFSVGEGRLPEDPRRGAARFELSGTLSDFVECAFRILKDHGDFYCCYPSRKKTVLMMLLEKNGFHAIRTQHIGERILLVHARKETANARETVSCSNTDRQPE